MITTLSPGFVSLQADACRTLRPVDVKKMLSSTRDTSGRCTKKLPVERYCERLNEPKCGHGVTHEWLAQCSLMQFMGEIDLSPGGYMLRRTKPRIVKQKPFLNLDMASHQAPRMARMALRVFKPFTRLQDDPWTIDDDANAVSALEEFIKDAACPSWVVSRFEQHNRVKTRKRKASERTHECGGNQAPGDREAHEDEGEDEIDQAVLRRQTEVPPTPQDRTGECGRGVHYSYCSSENIDTVARWVQGWSVRDRLFFLSMPNFYCFACDLHLNGPTQKQDHLGITSTRGKKHQRGVKQVQRAIEQGTVLSSADQGDPVWVIGAQNFLDRFKPMHEQVTLPDIKYACLYCRAAFTTWNEMVRHLTHPQGAACVMYADVQRRRQQEMSIWRRELANAGIRASSESCGHRGCQNVAVLTAACSICPEHCKSLFCPDHCYCCVCHHWYEASELTIDEDICPYLHRKRHCRPGYVCDLCAGTSDGKTSDGKLDDRSIALQALCGTNMITALATVNGDTARLCGEGNCCGPAVTTTSKPPWEPWVRRQMVFQVNYAGGQYATKLAYLCRTYGVTSMSSANYTVVGASGKLFRLLVYDQPQLEPDVESSDFPLTVWLAQEGH